MTTPIGATQIEIAKFRCYVVPSNSDHVNRLKKMSSLLGDLSDSAIEEEISQRLMAVLNQIKEAEQATEQAFQALLKPAETT
ncbi:hypothetical protein [Pseudomonas cedrina]|nr:hypothetical protein [Pseudomonas cedrina]